MLGPALQCSNVTSCSRLSGDVFTFTHTLVRCQAANFFFNRPIVVRQRRKICCAHLFGAYFCKKLFLLFPPFTSFNQHTSFMMRSRVKIASLPKQGHPTPFQLSRVAETPIPIAAISMPEERSWELGACLVVLLLEQRATCCLPLLEEAQNFGLKNRELVLPWCETQNSYLL